MKLMDDGSPVVIKGSESCWGFGLRHLRSASLLGTAMVSPKWVPGAPAESGRLGSEGEVHDLNFPAHSGRIWLPGQLPPSPPSPGPAELFPRVSWLADSLTSPGWVICICSGFLSTYFLFYLFFLRKSYFCKVFITS